MSADHLTWNEDEVFDFLAKEFPQAFSGGKTHQIISLAPGRLQLFFTAGEGQLRPGGTVSGPTQLELADFAVYFLLLAHHGTKGRLCVTTNLTCSFLRKPQAGQLLCDVELLKHGKTLAVADVKIQAESGELVSHLELTYYTGAAL